LTNTCNTTDVACDPRNCDSVFERVIVSFINRGGTSIYWDLRTDFTDPGPYTFQVQIGYTGNASATDWTPVGSDVVDAFSMTDPDDHISGDIVYTHYRIRLTTDLGVYYSQPTSIEGTLDPESWRILQHTYFTETLKFRRDLRCQLGLLLKRRITGTPCPRCTSEETGDIKDPQCEVCVGTGFTCGYFYPVDCVWIRPTPSETDLQLDGETKGPWSLVKIKGEMLLIPMVDPYDVWVNLRTDDRYYIGPIQNTKEIRGTPILGSVELKLAPVNDVIYKVQIPQQAAYAALLAG